MSVSIGRLYTKEFEKLNRSGNIALALSIASFVISLLALGISIIPLMR
jgi:hypothetical protein